MRKYTLILLLVVTATTMFMLQACHNAKNEKIVEQEQDEYDGPREIAEQEFEMTKDPATGKVPIERLWDAINYTRGLQQSNNYRSLALNWQERGPIYDSVGPSGNSRAGASYTAGKINGFIVDASDLTGNTIFCGGAAGGIWKCTNFLSTTAPPNWVAINDYMGNLSISSFAQDPTNPDIFYVGTGEAVYASNAVRGNGVYKSIDHGVTWNQLPSTASITTTFKIMCDASGNIYHATRGSGLRRSNDGGTSWVTITPSGASTACTDFEITTNGKLYASFGYYGTSVSHRYTTTPATASSVIGWNTSTGILASTYRMELAAVADTVYAVTCNSAYNTDNCYKSIDGGATFTKMNTSTLSSGIANTQGWYNLTLSINPENSHELIVGGLDAYKSIDDGQSFARITYWASQSPYVHADHHFMIWHKPDGATNSRIIMGTDGGIFYSTNNGLTFRDRNQNLAIKQFYSCAMHPTAGSNYLLAGAQDNGVHQFKNAGLSYSTEVYGGDGAFVAIDQNEPQYQFGSYVYNVYRRSIDGGVNWSSFSLASSIGKFINPFDYDDVQNIMLCSYSSNTFLRWNDPQTATSASTASKTTVTLSELNGGVSTVEVSPYTTGRAFFGSDNGRIVRVENTITTTGTGSGDVTLLSSPVTGGNVSCIAIGTNDQNLLAVYSNYGINNVWYSNDGGSNWTAIDGNLPDMPVRWAVFHPTDNTKVLIATEAGVYTTGLINGSSTQWFPSPGFPLTRTDMLKIRKNDNTVVAATHGRGVFSGNILDILPLKDITLTGNIESESRVALSWKTIDASNKVKYYVQYSTDGINFNKVAELPYNVTNYKHTLSSSVGYYRIMGVEPNSAPVFSNIVNVKSNKPAKGLLVKITPNPVSNIGNFIISSSVSGNYTWQLCNVQGSILKQGNGNLQAGSSTNQPIDVNKLSAGMYMIRVVQGKEKITSSFIKQ